MRLQEYETASNELKRLEGNSCRKQPEGEFSCESSSITSSENVIEEDHALAASRMRLHSLSENLKAITKIHSEVCFLNINDLAESSFVMYCASTTCHFTGSPAVENETRGLKFPTAICA